MDSAYQKVVERAKALGMEDGQLTMEELDYAIKVALHEQSKNFAPAVLEALKSQQRSMFDELVKHIQQQQKNNRPF